MTFRPFSTRTRILTILILTVLPLEPLLAKNKSGSTKLERQKKTYKVPGVTAISAAKRHGYQFLSRGPSKKSRNRSRPTQSCDFMGMHWTTASKKTCRISGFLGNKPKCRMLRKEWRIKEIKLKGNYVWTTRPANTTSPNFSVRVTNSSTKTQVLSIDSVTFEGPIGPSNSWQDAFSHCSDANYQ
jgi:hypothetical protein